MTEHSEQHSPQHSEQHSPPDAHPETDRTPPSSTDLGDHATGDLVVDAALQDLQNAPADDLDAQLEAAGRVHQTLQARLSDLGGA
ncbi:MAG TPA: hypothetical protein VGN48_00545 [Pedococcus sp.]|nr:hypothetical protein [Pedococcus sp.]HEV7194507.1 hypothetical protein [Pedococcus sp.]